MLDTTCKRAAHLVDLRDTETIDVLGPTIQFLTPPGQGNDDPCVMRGIIPPDVPVPLHSHHDPETFFMVSGELEGLTEADGGFEWVRIRPGNVFHVPGDAKHAFRNVGDRPAVSLITATSRMARFFKEIGRPVSLAPMPPSAEVLRHFMETAARFGYWNATSEENAEVGIVLPPPA